MKRSNEICSYNLDQGCVYEAWKLIAFGGEAKAAEMLAQTCLFFHEMIFHSEKKDVYNDQQSYWKNHVCTEFKAYESDYINRMDSVVWRELYCFYSNQMKEILGQCNKLNSIIGVGERNAKFRMYEILEHFYDYFLSPYANKEAQYYYGECLYYGFENNLDDQDAFIFYKLSADQGHMEAQYMLATCYNDGIEEDPDGVLAFKYFKLSADQGYADAQYMVGIFYDEHFVEDDNSEEKAFEYLSEAANQGHIEAKNRITKLLSYIS